jgi:hypothetical protein
MKKKDPRQQYRDRKMTQTEFLRLICALANLSAFERVEKLT